MTGAVLAAALTGYLTGLLAATAAWFAYHRYP